MSGAMSDGSTRGSNPLYLLTLLRGGVLVAYLAHNQMTWSELHYACAIQRQTKKHRV